MKMTPAQLKLLHTAMNHVFLPASYNDYARRKLTAERWRWEWMYRARINNNRAVEYFHKRGFNDEDIDTALRYLTPNNRFDPEQTKFSGYNMTDEQKEWIDNAPYIELLRLWRFGESGSPIFEGASGKHYALTMQRKRKEVGDAAHVAASKEIGW